MILHFFLIFQRYEHKGEVVVEVESHKSCQCGCRIKEEVNFIFVIPLSHAKIRAP